MKKKLIPWWVWLIVLPIVIGAILGGCKVLEIFKPAPIMN